MGRKPKAEDARHVDWLHVRVTRAVRESLEEQASRAAVPMSELIRDGLAVVLAKPAARSDADAVTSSEGG